jgi:hypothetical protein
VILVDGNTYGYTDKIRVFGYDFRRALVCEKRMRPWTGDAYGNAESFHGTIFEIDFDERFWAEHEAMLELGEWFDDLRGHGGYHGDEPTETFDVAFLLRYLRGCARVLRELRDGKTVRVPR